VGSASAAPSQIAFDSSSIADGVYDVRVAAVDAFGNQGRPTRAPGITFWYISVIEGHDHEH